MRDEEFGGYLLGKLSLPGGHAFHLGLRGDWRAYSKQLSPTFRGGYAGAFGPLTAKILYGQAVYEPGAYDLTQATGLKPERSDTLEANLQYTVWKLVLMAGAYHIRYANPIIATYQQTTNLDTRAMTGIDGSATLLLRPISVWASYSNVLQAEQSDGTGAVEPIGDIATHKAWAGITFDRRSVTATLLGRFMGPREPVASNPTGTVPAYFVLDAHVGFSHVGVDPLSLGFTVNNVLDSSYQHPGVGTADSGDVPGGSAGLYNSRLPQPRRSFFVSLGLDI
jgi:outer membrane receptor protein involved in Fe transport